MKKIKKVLVANRGEIAIRITRACTELGIKTIAIYSREDRLALHRFKADESYLIGEGKSPVDAYLGIEEIVNIALEKKIDAIHPGYGFLAESSQFAKACLDAEITFIGPTPDVITNMGEKIYARNLAKSLGIPVVPGTESSVETETDVLHFAKNYGYPILLKASLGGGGRGMRVVRKESELLTQLELAKSESKKAFGSDEVFIERYLDEVKHIEVQILGDQQGNIVHLYERDCSIQRRHQKVVEIAPSLNLDEKIKDKLFIDAVKIAKAVNYTNAGTVEFIIDSNNNYYFIEMNTRLQVEHTITEMITGIDLLHAQIRIAEGHPLSHPDIGIKSQKTIQRNGFAIQCRITTEDPLNNFLPDTGRIQAYRTAAGFGIRLDGACAGSGHRVTIDYDSLLVKIISFAQSFRTAVSKMYRSLNEFRIRGVKTNIGFLENLIQHPDFLNGKCKTSFIESHPELFILTPKKDRATKLLSYIASVTINGSDEIKHHKIEKSFFDPPIPHVDYRMPLPRGTKHKLDELGAEGVSKWVLEQKSLLITDTTFRDAHQSLIATRLRTFDILKIAHITARFLPDLFSHEMWGGATFDVCYRFLKEDPWDRLHKMRDAIPNVLFQMLLRGSNAVGYTNYADNVVEEFVKLSAEGGIDVFRVFDSLNWVTNMKVAIEAVLKTGKICETAICYTGDILDKNRPKYDIKYYIKIAKELEKMGAHILGIKDMAGLCKPLAAFELIKALKQEVGIPIHFHTHDTSSNGLATLLKVTEAGVDIVDAAIGQMSGLTSQPNMNSLAFTLIGNERSTNLDTDNLRKLSSFWEVTREYYYTFESGLKSGTADVYRHEIPGGQYSNLKRRAVELGLGHHWDELKDMYERVNYELGDIVKVTPSSKMVADFAMFMVKNNLTFNQLYNTGPNDLNFPQSVIEYFKGMLGQPYGGFPNTLQNIVLNGDTPITDRPGKHIPPVDYNKIQSNLEKKHHRKFSMEEVMSYVLYPDVFVDYIKHCDEYGDTSVIPTKAFFYGLNIGEETSIEIEEGKSLIVELQAIGKLKEGGNRIIHFDLNGH
ncbi:MAG: pyruvate carboxylase, partial [Spirochaetota bacterium]|nr:pyruvate carboxylase [Spirochaetota bacterium]